MYDANKNEVLHERMQAVLRAAYEAAFDEGNQLDDIYVNEAESGGHADYADTKVATASEVAEGINFLRLLKKFCNGTLTGAEIEDHTARLTPFIQ